MRELTVRICFRSPCLGSVKDRRSAGRFLLPRDPRGNVTFLASWHRANMRFAATLLGRHQDEVSKIVWDTAVDGPSSCGVYQRYHKRKETEEDGRARRLRYAIHEAFLPGCVVGINCVVPTPITDDDFWELMRMAGRYKGISPFGGGNGEYGFFEVVSIRNRRGHGHELSKPEVKRQEPSEVVTPTAPVTGD